MKQIHKILLPVVLLTQLFVIPVASGATPSLTVQIKFGALCLQSSGTVGPQSKIVLAKCNSSDPTQLFLFPSLPSGTFNFKSDGSCLTAPKTILGTDLIKQPCTAFGDTRFGNQFWRWDGSRLTMYSSWCLDIENGREAVGTPAQIWSCVNRPNSNQAIQAQTFVIVDISSGRVVPTVGMTPTSVASVPKANPMSIYNSNGIDVCNASEQGATRQEAIQSFCKYVLDMSPEKLRTQLMIEWTRTPGVQQQHLFLVERCNLDAAEVKQAKATWAEMNIASYKSDKDLLKFIVFVDVISGLSSAKDIYKLGKNVSAEKFKKHFSTRLKSKTLALAATNLAPKYKIPTDIWGTIGSAVNTGNVLKQFVRTQQEKRFNFFEWSIICQS